MWIYFEFGDMLLPYAYMRFILYQRQRIMDVAPEVEFTFNFPRSDGRVRAGKCDPSLVNNDIILVLHEFKAIMCSRLSKNRGVARRQTEYT